MSILLTVTYFVYHDLLQMLRYRFSYMVCTGSASCVRLPVPKLVKLDNNKMCLRRISMVIVQVHTLGYVISRMVYSSLYLYRID